MGVLDEWGDALVQEGLREAADTFFGARAALDEEIAYFETQAGKLRLQAGEIRSWFAGLNCLLGSESSTRLFFDSLGVTLDDPSLYSLQACSLQFRRPHSFTRKGLFAKTVWEVYEPLARLIEVYMHGKPYSDALHPGRVMITVNHNQLRRLCDRINERITAVNESNRPSETLGFAKRMDQGQLLKESVTGGGGQTWTLDRDLAYAPIIFEDQNLPAFPDLPLDSKAHAALEECCARIFSQRRSHVDAILDEVFDPKDKTVCVLDRSGQ
jgi:hypothetical protein